MNRISLWSFALALSMVSQASHGAEDDGKVTMALEDWENILTELDTSEREDRPQVAISRLERHIKGEFVKGLFTAELTERFEVHDAGGHVRVPVLDGEVSVEEVLLDGAQTSLLEENGMYTLGVNEPGVYEVNIKFYWGQDLSRFDRRLFFRLPEGGVTGFSVNVVEADINAKVSAGAFTSVQSNTDGTRLIGHLDSTGNFDISWTRKATHRGDEKVKMEAELTTLFTVEEAVIRGKSVFNMRVLEGETDVVRLSIPAGIEIVKVEGDSVLQWRTEAVDGGVLIVLLRYLVMDHTELTVHFQAPAKVGDKVPLKMPLPEDGTPMAGVAGVQGPVGFEITTALVENAEERTGRDIPTRLADLSLNPLLFGFRFSSPPTIEVNLTRNRQVELTSTLVEDVQASTVIIEDGTEITKMKIRIRNNTKEYLSVKLPKGAWLTHSLVEGQPVRPAITQDESGEVLLVPLRQSERFGDGEARMHTVRPGETLSDIANFYYSDPTQWSSILSANPETLMSANSVESGLQVKIPAAKGGGVEEASFVIELAYKTSRKELGSFGRSTVEMPRLDVDTLKVTWHLFLPSVLDPLSFDANLTQYSAVRYDPFRRVIDFLDRAMEISYAWAGGGKYSNILAQRKVIYQNETYDRSGSKALRSSFPLVGKRYRFKRILLGRETPQIAFFYVHKNASTVVHWIAIIAAFLATSLVIRRPKRIFSWVSMMVAVVVLLLLGHYFLGTHKRILWGVDLALLASLARLRAGPLFIRIRETLISPWSVLEFVTIRNLLAMVGILFVIVLILKYPLLFSSFACVTLVFKWMWGRSHEKKEVQHV